MRNALLLAVVAVLGGTTIARAQSAVSDSLILPSPVPAQAILDLHDTLQLSEAQTAKLRTLARAQVVALTHATAAFLRAEADLLDASGKDDLAARRLALEKRARVSIDGEMNLLQAEKDSRGVLTADQRAKLETILKATDATQRQRQVALWTPLVMPAAVTRALFRDSVARDSGQVRLKVSPSYAEIYIDGARLGTNFKQVTLAVGPHTVRFVAPGCGVPVEQQITIAKGELLILPPVVIPGCRDD